MRVLALLPILLVAACGDAVVTQGPGLQGSPAASLRLEYRAAPDAQPRVVTLTCDPPGGSHPNPAAACARLAEQPDLLEPLPPDRRCTQQYGGPETATITGTWRGQPVDVTHSRTNGCGIARWQALGPVLPS